MITKWYQSLDQLIFNFSSFKDKDLLSKHQSSFHPGDSCVYQLLAVTYDIFSSFDCNPTLESHGLFLDKMVLVEFISMNHKLCELKISKSFTQWPNIRLGTYSRRCTTGSILRPLFFIICINDLTNDLKSNVKLFTDATFLFSEICDPLETANVLNNYLRKRKIRK